MLDCECCNCCLPTTLSVFGQDRMTWGRRDSRVSRLAPAPGASITLRSSDHLVGFSSYSLFTRCCDYILISIRESSLPYPWVYNLVRYPGQSSNHHGPAVSFSATTPRTSGRRDHLIPPTWSATSAGGPVILATRFTASPALAHTSSNPASSWRGPLSTRMGSRDTSRLSYKAQRKEQAFRCPTRKAAFWSIASYAPTTWTGSAPERRVWRLKGG